MIRGRFVALLMLFLAAPTLAQACVCSKAPPGMCPGLQKDDVVFVGTVIAAENVPPDRKFACHASSCSLPFSNQRTLCRRKHRPRSISLPAAKMATAPSSSSKASNISCSPIERTTAGSSPQFAAALGPLPKVAR